MCSHVLLFMYCLQNIRDNTRNGKIKEMSVDKILAKINRTYARYLSEHITQLTKTQYLEPFVFLKK